MLKNLALKYLKNGYNCSQCILMACCEYYNLNLPKQCYEMCNGIYNGMGIGGMCSVLTACIMIISIMHPEDIACKRMLMIDCFNEKNKGINCGKIRQDDCETIISNACEILERINIE